MKFSQKLLFGTGFIVWLLVVAAAIWMLSSILREPVVTANADDDFLEPATPQSTSYFLGSVADYSIDFDRGKSEMLAAGDARITGIVTSNGKPVEGVILRLALNGNLTSQSGTTDQNGQYAIPVPAGQYHIVGYELFGDAAHEALPGKIARPGPPDLDQTFDVAAGEAAIGPKLEFVDPILKIEPMGEVSVTEDVVARWHPYPGAQSYVVKIYESQGLNASHWTRLGPERAVTEAMVNFAAQGVELKIDHYYTLQIVAIDANDDSLSQTLPIWRQSKDFKVVEQENQ